MHRFSKPVSAEVVNYNISLSVSKLDILSYITELFLPAFPISLPNSLHFGIISESLEIIPYHTIQLCENNSLQISTGFTPSSRK